MRCIDDRLVVVGNSKNGSQRGLCESKLLRCEPAHVKASFLIEREDRERSPNDAGGLKLLAATGRLQVAQDLE